MLANILWIIAGLALLIIGAEFLVKGASNIAKRFHIPEILIGLTIVAIGTSMPELIITVEAALKGSADLIVGNSIGSDLCNLLFILGMMAVLKPIEISEETKKVHIPIAFASTVLIFFMTTKLGIINRIEGWFLIGLFIAYIAYPILLDRKKIIEEYRAEKEKNKRKKKLKEKNTILQIISIIVGIIILKIGGDLVTDYASIIAVDFGISERIIGLTIVAIGTALPELITSIVATISNDADLGVGNLIGSSVLNSFLILGLGAIVSPIVISTEFISNLILLMVSTLLIWIFCYIPKKDTLTRNKGLILILIYVIYFAKLFI